MATGLALMPEWAEELAVVPAAAGVADAGIAARAGGTGGPDLAALSRGVALGEEAALAALYELWFDRALALAGAATRRTALAGEAAGLDIVQDAFVRVIRSMRPMATGEDVERWMVRVIKTTALDHLRRESRRVARERRRASDGRGTRADGGPDAAAELGERIAWLRGRLNELTEEERVLLGLRFGMDRTLEQAGAGAGMSGGAAHGRLRRALERLRGSAGSVRDE